MNENRSKRLGRTEQNEATIRRTASEHYPASARRQQEEKEEHRSEYKEVVRREIARAKTRPSEVRDLLLEIYESVLTDSGFEIRARDLTRTVEESTGDEKKKSVVYRYNAPAPKFPSLPGGFGKLSETGVVSAVEKVCYSDTAGQGEEVEVNISCETKGLRFADQFVVETCIKITTSSDEMTTVKCYVRLKWGKVRENRWLESLITKATQIKIKKKYELMFKKIIEQLSHEKEEEDVLPTLKKENDEKGKVDDLYYLAERTLERRNVNMLFCVFFSVVIFSLGFCCGRSEEYISQLLFLRM